MRTRSGRKFSNAFSASSMLTNTNTGLPAHLGYAAIALAATLVTMPMADTPEKRIKKKLVELLKKEGIWYFFPASNGMGRAGIPDVVCIINGRFVGIECKADATKKPTVLQLECARQIKNAGGLWFLVYDDCSMEQVKLLKLW